MKIECGKIWVGGALLLIVLVGAWFRLYHHADWLHFELDQARDSILISEAIEKGPGELTLLGPRAAGTMLRLGPFFYYQEYLSALIFGNTPAGMDIIGVIISILAIPLMYWFLRSFFSRLISLAGAALLATSLFAVTYGRFAWNPNMLIFFGPGLLLSWWQWETKRKVWALYTAAICLGIGIQLHFLPFLVFPLISAAYLFWVKLRRILKFKDQKLEAGKPKKPVWLHYGLAALVLLVLNLPVLINESLTGGDNATEFIKAFESKTEKGEDHNLVENLARNAGEYAAGYFLIVTGNEGTDMLGLEFMRGGKLINVTCDKVCRQRLPLTAAAWIFFAGGLLLGLRQLVLRWRGARRSKKETARLDFLVLNIFLLGATFTGFLPVAYKFPPRFLLTTLPVALVLFAFWLQAIEEAVAYGSGVFLTAGRRLKEKKKQTRIAKQEQAGTGRAAQGVVVILTLGFVVLNGHYNWQRFSQQAIAHTAAAAGVDRDLVLKEDLRFTMVQQELILDWILAHSQHETIFVWAPPKYYRPFVYHLRYQKNKDGRRLRFSAPCEEADYFAVTKTKSPEKFFDKGGDVFEGGLVESFGTLSVYKLAIKQEDERVSEEKIEQYCEPLEEEKPAKKARRYLWREVFNRE